MALPAAPDGVCVLSTVNALSLRINWHTVSTASSYSVYRSEVPHDDFSLASSGIPGLTYYDDPQSSGLTLNLQNAWWYRVSATNGSGEGPLSPPSTFQPYGELINQNLPRPGLSMWSLI